MDAYDYIVVGAGSAGCALAHRLSSEPGTRVLLIEAGPGARHPFIAMPAAFTLAISSRRFDWRYMSEVEAGLASRRIPCPRGLVMGGSSSINGMAFVRGQAVDFDAWAYEGLDGWSYADCLPYFKRLETYVGKPSPFRGQSGPLHVTAPVFSTPLNEVFLEACRQAGYVLSEDTNGPRQEGFGVMDQTIFAGVRESAARAYIDPLRGRPGLTILNRCLVLKVRFEGRRAAGIDYVRRGTPGTALAAREVILSAGAINSPQLLMLSGVGSADALRALGIPIVLDHPAVGQNLQDHVDVSLKQTCPLPRTMTPALRLDRKIAIFLRWALTRGGLGATNHFEAAGYICTRSSLSRPDAQICFIPLLAKEDGSRVAGGHGYQTTIMALRPKSRGQVTLRSSDSRSPPLIQFNYLKEPEDILPLREGVRRVREIFAQKAFDGLRGDELAPGRDAVTDADLDSFVRATGKSTHHPCGTCRMGNDDASVVGGDGCVHGVEGLRVVDASIMPTITSGNINAAVIMLAEKLSDAILGRPRLPKEAI